MSSTARVSFYRGIGASPRWLCPYEHPCSRQGRAMIGSAERDGLSEERPVVCVTCGARGVQSTRLDLARPERKAQRRKVA